MKDSVILKKDNHNIIKENKKMSLAKSYIEDSRPNFLLQSKIISKLNQQNPLQLLKVKIDSGWMSEEYMVDWIQRKARAQANIDHIRHCAQYILQHNGTTSGGGTGFRVFNKTVFHISHGRVGENDGCTVFFICTKQKVAPNNPQNGTCYIVGIGHHTGTTNYHLDWGCGQGSFITNENINL